MLAVGEGGGCSSYGSQTPQGTHRLQGHTASCKMSRTFPERSPQARGGRDWGEERRQWGGGSLPHTEHWKAELAPRAGPLICRCPSETTHPLPRTPRPQS